MPTGRAVGTAAAGGAVAEAAEAAALTAADAGVAEAAAAAAVTHRDRWDCWDCRVLEAGPNYAADSGLLVLVDCSVSERLLHPPVSLQQQRRSDPAAPLLRCDRQERSGREEAALPWAEL